MRLDLGCGERKKAGFTGIDILDYYSLYPGMFVKHNLNKGIPYEDNSVDEIYTNHYLEHHPNLFSFIDEIYRVCKDKAKITIIVPHFTSNKSEFHYGVWGYYSLKGFVGNRKNYKSYFKVIQRKLVFGGFYKLFSFFNYIPYIYENTFLRSFIFCNEVLIKLEVVKGR